MIGLDRCLIEIAHHLTSAVLPAGCASGLVLLFFNKMAFSNLILARGDTFLYFYPYWHAAAASLRAARVPSGTRPFSWARPCWPTARQASSIPLIGPLAVSRDALRGQRQHPPASVYRCRRCLSGRKTCSVDCPLNGRPGFRRLFAFGGYLTAQVEHINQLQGLAWLPWFLLAADLAGKADAAFLAAAA